MLIARRLRIDCVNGLYLGLYLGLLEASDCLPHHLAGALRSASALMTSLMTSLIAPLIISQELSDQLQLCPGGASDPSAFLNVGTDLELACEVRASSP